MIMNLVHNIQGYVDPEDESASSARSKSGVGDTSHSGGGYGQKKASKKKTRSTLLKKKKAAHDALRPAPILNMMGIGVRIHTPGASPATSRCGRNNPSRRRHLW